MSKTQGNQRAFIQCTNCGEIMTGTLTEDGDLIPIGVESGGKCGGAEFEVVTMPDSTGSRPASVQTRPPG